MKTDRLILTNQQQAFTDHYIKNGFNGTQAAIAAGYAKDSAAGYASSLIQHPLIKPRIDKARDALDAEFEKKLGITLKDKVKLLKRMLDDIILEGEVIDKRNVTPALAIMDMLNKMQGHYMPDRSLKVTVDATKERLIAARKKYEEF